MRYIIETVLNEQAIKEAIGFYHDSINSQPFMEPIITPLYGTKYDPANPPSTNTMAPNVGDTKTFALKLTQREIDWIYSNISEDSSDTATSINTKLNDLHN